MVETQLKRGGRVHKVVDLKLPMLGIEAKSPPPSTHPSLPFPGGVDQEGAGLTTPFRSLRPCLVPTEGPFVPF